MNESSAASRVFIIAEAGVNHNGSLQTALRLVDAAADAGADAVKFQTFKAEQVISRSAPKAAYQRKTTNAAQSQLDMARALELSRDDHCALIEQCSKRSIEFISSPFDLDSIDLLASLGLEQLKIPSGEITNLPYLRRIGGLGKRLILSTGMSTLLEVGDAIDILTEAGAQRECIALLHCNTQYPTPPEDANLRAIHTLTQAFPGMRVGYSDHTLGIEIALAAAAMGAAILEKHLTLDRTMTGPDHAASIEAHELAALVAAVRNIEKALGSGVKHPSPSERENLPVGRKSIVASREIQIGEVFSEDNLAVKRPGTGISPMHWDRIIGARASRSYNADDLIQSE